MASLVPLYVGGLGVTGLLYEASSPALDNHTRYLSGLLLAIGLAFAWCVFRIETRSTVVRLLTFLVLVGGLARLLSISLHGGTAVSLFGLAMELGVTPLLCLWQARVARRSLWLQND